MRFLLDLSLPIKLAAILGKKGLEAVHVREYGLNRASDAEIVARSMAEGRNVVTTGGDFERMFSSPPEHLPSVVVVREGHSLQVEAMGEILSWIGSRPDFAPREGYLIGVHRHRIRIYPLPRAKG